MYYPTLSEVQKLKKYGNLVPIYREIVADLETPVSAYLKMARGAHSFLLESVEGGERLARYSFIGTEPYLILKTGGGENIDPLLAVEKELNKYRLVMVPELPRFHGGAVGYLAYEVVKHFEQLPSPHGDPLGLPESVFMFADTVLVFDHLTHKIKIVSHAHLDGDVERAYLKAVEKIDSLAERLSQPMEQGPKEKGMPASPSSVWSNLSQAEFEARVDQAKEYICAGEIIQLVLSQRLCRTTNASPFEIYRALRTI
ncbi:MAG: anthranilate synthase component I, partial [Dehalococcoidia bacterium]